MTRLFLGILVAGSLVTAAGAQSLDALPGAAINAKRPLSGDKKVRYALRQLELTKEQAAQANGLIESLFTKDAQPNVDIDRIRQLVREMQEAKEQKDEARVQQLQGEIKQMGRGADNEPAFYENFRKMLTDTQKTRLAAIRSRLTRNPSGAVRPVDVLDTARALELSEKQLTNVRRIELRFRADANARVQYDDKRRVQLVNGLIARVQDELNNAQKTEFNHRIALIRPDTIEKTLRPVK